METDRYPEAQGDREVQDDQIRSPPNEMVAEEPEVVLIAASQVQVPPENLDDDSVEDLDTIPQRNPPNPVASRQRFRKFHYEDSAGPRDVLRHLQELAGQWLRPDNHTKEQIVEMLVQEQFQAVIPRSSEIGYRDISLGSESLAKSCCLLLAQPTCEK